MGGRRERREMRRELDRRRKDGVRAAKAWLEEDGWAREGAAWVKWPFRLERGIVRVGNLSLVQWDLERVDEHPGRCSFSDVTLPLMPLIVLMEREAW